MIAKFTSGLATIAAPDHNPARSAADAGRDSLALMMIILALLAALFLVLLSVAFYRYRQRLAQQRRPMEPPLRDAWQVSAERVEPWPEADRDEQ